MKTWQEKLNSGKPYEIKTSPLDFAGIKKGQQMLIPSAQILDAYICKLPAGQVVDLQELRAGLAREYGAEVCCPMVTGIQLRVVAEAAFEAYQAGSSIDTITPFWRAMHAQASTIKRSASTQGLSWNNKTENKTRHKITGPNENDRNRKSSYYSTHLSKHGKYISALYRPFIY